MAASRTRPTKADPLDRVLLDAAAQALRDAAALAHAREADETALRRRPPRSAAATVVVGYSGGRDSTALLHAMTRLARQRASGLREAVAVHVHHGLSRHADEWLAHCEKHAALIGARFIARHVSVQRAGRGLEAAARAARYRALADVAEEIGAEFVCCAHHRDDRIETFLIQWMRGAGPEGLAAFPAARALADDGPLLP